MKQRHSAARAFERALANARMRHQERAVIEQMATEAELALIEQCPVKVGDIHTFKDGDRTKRLKVRYIKARLDTNQWVLVGSLLRADGKMQVLTSSAHIDFPKESA